MFAQARLQSLEFNKLVAPKKLKEPHANKPNRNTHPQSLLTNPTLYATPASSLTVLN